MQRQVAQSIRVGATSSVRRRLLCASSLVALTPPSFALMPADLGPLPVVRLDPEQSDRFRVWMTFILVQQFKQGPSPRWFHRDCAGLARYVVGEALRVHDQRWRQANGVEGCRLPPELSLRPEQLSLHNSWTALDGSRQAFVTALALIQNNSRPLGKESARARPGDLMFFDQGVEQHLMIWMGTWIAYHNGQTPVSARTTNTTNTTNTTSATLKSGKQLISTEDNGLRAVTPTELLQWRDTRWRPRDDNPNFAGFYRLAFLSR